MESTCYQDAIGILHQPAPWNHVTWTSTDGIILSGEQRDWCRDIAVCRLCANHRDELNRYIREEEAKGLERITPR